MFKKLLCIFSVVLLCACSSKVSQKNYLKVKTNMTLEQVSKVLGAPSKQTDVPLGALSIRAATWTGNGNKIIVQFLDNKVAFKTYSGHSATTVNLK